MSLGGDIAAAKERKKEKEKKKGKKGKEKRKEKNKFFNNKEFFNFAQNFLIFAIDHIGSAMRLRANTGVLYPFFLCFVFLFSFLFSSVSLSLRVSYACRR